MTEKYTEALVKSMKSVKKDATAAEDAPFLIVLVKSTTGDPTDGKTGQLVINTVDNNIKMYADSAWRQLASW